jgi:hypothetical protein
MLTKECPRCGGQVFRDYEDFFCLQCGWRPSYVDGVLATIFLHKRPYKSCGPRLKDSREHERDKF